MVSALSSVYFNLRRIPRHYVIRGLQIGCLTFVLLIFCLFVTPVRNTVFTGTFRKEFHDYRTMDVLMMKMTPSGQGDVTKRHYCAAYSKPPAVNEAEIRAKMIKNPSLGSEVFPLPDPDHAYFFPVLSADVKLSFLKMYSIVSKIFDEAGIQYFIRAGTLLGVHRHHGYIPWDDDMDLAVNVSDLMKVKEKLSCIEGYILMVNPHAVWRFFPNNTGVPGFPVIDFFYYTENSEFVFNMPHFAYLKSDIFPLTYGEFEGLSVPIPKNTEEVLRSQYDYETCVPGKGNHRNKKKITPIPVKCSSLSYLYTMYHLRS